MNVLVLGGGGREHAICHALRRSKRLRSLFVMPGNAGTEQIGTNFPGDPANIPAVLEVARRERIDLTIVGPEEPLSVGIVDAFEAAGQRIFGPSAAAAKLEADKWYAKQVMRQQSVPTADARMFTEYYLAKKYIATRDEPLVVKAAGLAKGKGVVVCDDPAQALLVAERMLVKGEFGPAGGAIVVEEKLDGREASVMAIIDGTTIQILDPAQDYKRLRDGDEGPNTGGMGSFCPAGTIDEATMHLIESQVFVPILDGLIREGIHYRGVLYAGVMLTRGGPKVLEFNCRFGDPETQVVLPRMKTELLDVLEAAVDGRLDQVAIEWDPRAAVCVVMASGGYPDTQAPPATIRNLPRDEEDVFVFHAGTKRAVSGESLATGGRVLGVTALGATLSDARTRAYGVVDQIRFEGAQYRFDIGATPPVFEDGPNPAPTGAV